MRVLIITLLGALAIIGALFVSAPDIKQAYTAERACGAYAERWWEADNREDAVMPLYDTHSGEPTGKYWTFDPRPQQQEKLKATQGFSAAGCSGNINDFRISQLGINCNFASEKECR